MSMDTHVDEQQPQINQKLTFDDEVEVAAPVATLQLNQAPVVPKKKAPAKRPSIGAGARKSPCKTPKLKDYFPLLTSSSSSSSNISDAIHQPDQTPKPAIEGVPVEPLKPPPAIVLSAWGDGLSGNTSNNEPSQEVCATPKGSQEDKPVPAPLEEAIFATPCHRPDPGVPFDITASLYKTPIVSSLKKNRTAEGALNSSVKKSVQFSRVNVFLFERKQGKLSDH